VASKQSDQTLRVIFVFPSAPHGSKLPPVLRFCIIRKALQYIDIEINKLTNSLKNVITDDKYPTDIVLANSNDFKMSVISCSDTRCRRTLQR